jgi:hypothetical protein
VGPLVAVAASLLLLWFASLLGVAVELGWQEAINTPKNRIVNNREILFIISSPFSQ